MDERIQKVLSAQGFCSRRAAEQLLAEGRIKVNGKRVKPGDRVDVRKDVLSVDGQQVYLKHRPKKLYYMLNKPRGYVTTVDDRHASKTVMELLEGVEERVYPVGRLDKDSEGLLLITNDGEFTNLVTHPSTELSKLYRVSVRPCPSEEQLISLSSGVRSDGDLLSARSVTLAVSEPDRGVLEIVLAEGKNREIRRMCDAVGLEVLRLKRLSIGPVRLSGLRSGGLRPLTKEEINALKGACKKGSASKRR